jgi:hypothetical protein
MHCPRCGQEQFSAEVHFCNSCGFPLDRVKELLAGDSIAPAPEKEIQKPEESPRRRGVRRGVALLFICLVLAPLTTLLGDRRGGFLPMMFLMAGLMRILYAVIFQEGAPRKKKKKKGSRLPYVPIATEQSGMATRGSALPPSRGVPVAGFNMRRVDTAEMVSPPSVTEHTTKLLNESQDSE